ncbi:MAG TPA: methylthioribulose 1-phosphate dehydratase [Vicinamibacteria bacterium]|nr:methylthioribulose 1-phosphate dehydratase [Vicinamibacteria bacterium]
MATLSELAPLVAAAGRALHARGWALATSGNFSTVVRRDPLVIAISRSGVDKGRLAAQDIIEVDGNGLPLEAEREPSDETVVHLAIVRERGAGAVLHTHSVWNTLLSEAAGDAGGLVLSGYEMLKGLAGVTTHEHEERVPILENTQDYARMSRDVKAALARHPDAHGLLLRGHGLYTWGRDLEQAQRHVEVLEFLFEVEGRLYAATGRLKAREARAVTGGKDGGG